MTTARMIFAHSYIYYQIGIERKVSVTLDQGRQMLIFTQYCISWFTLRECLYSVPLTCVAGVYRAIRILSLRCIQCCCGHSLAQHVDCYDVTLFRQYTGKKQSNQSSTRYKWPVLHRNILKNKIAKGAISYQL